MDKCIEHLFVFEGDGVIKDFPGNYSEFREWKREKEKEQSMLEKEIKKEKAPQTSTPRENKKLTFKEKQEFEKLTKEIEELEAEKTKLEAIFNGDIDEQIDFNQASTRFSEIKELLDEKEFRWLELSEKA